ncbi:hypothetical protein TSYNTROOL_18210 [Tepidanaerobacter syntrophicus]|nr:hypothetical protein TSYNTROPHJE_13480 [Tepidanaerobacter syntrophicus]GLI51735.1 hypothetical protein TSYNTROOL_18210 [Tepidanaerobacter syntrophicus]
MDLVDMQVAIAFGASVHPLTKMVPNVNNTVMANGKFEVSSDKNSPKVIVIVTRLSVKYCFNLLQPI